MSDPERQLQLLMYNDYLTARERAERTEEQRRIDRRIEEVHHLETIKGSHDCFLSPRGKHELRALEQQARFAELNAKAERGELFTGHAKIWNFIRAAK